MNDTILQCTVTIFYRRCGFWSAPSHAEKVMRGGETTRRIYTILISCVLLFVLIPTTVHAADSGYGENSLFRGKTLKYHSWTTTALTDGSDSTSESVSNRNNSYTPSYVFPANSELPIIGQAYVRASSAAGAVIGVIMSYSDGTTATYVTTATGEAYKDYFISAKSSKRVSSVRWFSEPETRFYEVDAMKEVAPDITPPAQPTGLAGTAEDALVKLTWNSNSEADFDHYNIYVNGVQKATAKTAGATITGLTNGTTYTFKVSAVDKSANESPLSLGVSLKPEAPPPPPPPDTEPPSVPTLSGRAGNKQALLTWSRSPETDVAGYKLYVNGQILGTYTQTGANVPELKNGQTYKFAVTSFDKSGNESAKSNVVSITPADQLSVTLVPNGDSIVVQVASGSGPYHIDWGAASKTVDQSQYVINGLKFETEYTVTVTDASGLTYTQKVNTGSIKGYVPPTFPNPQETFQHMLDVFGTAGTIALAIIGGALALGIMCVLALWGWRLLKRWLAKTA